MTMATSTGRVETRACETCGVQVEHREAAFVSGAAGTFWSAERHAAPCGLPCIGGGIGSEVIKPMRAAGKKLHQVTHGASGGPCTACVSEPISFSEFATRELEALELDRFAADLRRDPRRRARAAGLEPTDLIAIIFSEAASRTGGR